MSSILGLIRNRLFVPVLLISLLTLGLVGAVVLNTTSVGCYTANRIGAKVTSCIKPGRVGLVTPKPTSQGQPFTPPASYPATPYQPPASFPGSSNFPPYQPPSSGPSSGSFPPVNFPATGSTGPTLAVTCRLPVYGYQPGSGGFIVYPGGTFIADAKSGVTAPSPSPGTSTPGPYGGYPGWWGLTYDFAYSKWLPVPTQWVSPDGAHYAYPLGGDVYVQSAAGGPGIELGQGKNFAVLAAENDGVYVTAPFQQPGLWFLAYTGTTTQLSTTGYWQGESHGAAYGTATSSVPQGATNTIMKLDIRTGTLTDFFHVDYGQSNVQGFDLQGHPVIWASWQGGTAIFIASGPGLSTAIAGQTNGYYSPAFPSGRPIADSHGLWFSAGAGIALYSNQFWYWMGSIGGQLAGPCK